VTDWKNVVASDFPVAADLDSAVAELCAMLASPDPVVRDELSYPILLTWIRRGALDDRLEHLGAAMVARLEHPQVQARTFAPLILAAAVNREAVPEKATRGWRDAFVAWWLAETDIRGWDDELGWLHAIAHGADLAGALGASPRLAGDDLAGLLTVVARRVVTETDYRYAQMEEDRVARAMLKILVRDAVTEAGATGWLTVVDDLFATGGPGPLPVNVANTLAVLKSVYVMADRSALPHHAAVTDGIARRLHLVFEAYPPERS
jgi:hypothetical protein